MTRNNLVGKNSNCNKGILLLFDLWLQKHDL